jgi:hypothetical protein
MTEGEWMECDDPQVMLSFLQEAGQLSDRKLRLFAVACCRRIEYLLSDERTRRAMDLAELYADGMASEVDLAEADAEAWNARSQAWDEQVDSNRHADAAGAGEMAAWPAARDAAYLVAELSARVAATSDMRPYQCGLLRDLFGNPFRPPPPLSPSCLTPEVTSLATTIYESRSFDRLRELADALAAAGCTEAEVLAHLRSKGPHGRGCWVVDLLLRKS